jgi:Tfp pilus assembly protein PilO
MSRWPLLASLLLARLGSRTLLLTALAVATAAVWAVLIPRAERESARQQHQLAALRQATAAAPRPQAIAAPQMSTLQAFERRLASPDDMDSLQRQLWQQAAVAGLQLSKVDYRSEADASGQFTRLSITLPVTGPYPGVRRFIFALMAKFPGLSLAKLDLKRTSVEAPEVEATMHFTLLGRP